MLKFLQLSDIHHFFIDEEVNDDHQIQIALLDDLKDYYEKGETIDGVLICGDIANSCQKNQYEKALAFIEEICKIINCKSHEVYIVPGNHDKDRDSNNPLTRALLYKELRSRNGDEYFNEIKSKETDALNILYSPFRSYYEFAAKYRCCDSVAENILIGKNRGNIKLSPEDKIYWKAALYKTENFNLNLFGINSVLTSCKDDKTNPLFLPKLAYNITRSKWDINILMMHHPLTEKNIINYEDIQKTIDEKFHIQLYGHEHKQRSESDEASSRSEGVIRIYSGALNPHGDYDSDYCPSYNIIDIDIQEESTVKCIVNVDISSYKWNKSHFYKDTNESKKHQIPIDNTSFGKPSRANNNKDVLGAPEVNMKELQYKFMSRSDRKSLINKIIPELYDDDCSEHINSINFLKRLESEEKKVELWNIINQ